ncbi:hypothetical protein [Comamonas sp.]|uniref:hypothetical protein n=1 Tax=Comamonas sp. TaxID=34028 RepID=UPI00258BD19B|nr:hypothetical protein [Comamonas sp.]
MSLSFVNLHGASITPAKMEAMRAAGAEAERARRAANKPTELTHKGWRVVGIPPGLLESAKAEHASVIETARKAGLPGDKPFDEAEWLRKQRRQAVRSKPYMLREAAAQCAELATKGGWLEVRVNELTSK